MREQWPFINSLSSRNIGYNFTTVTRTSYALILSGSYRDGVSYGGGDTFTSERVSAKTIRMEVLDEAPSQNIFHVRRW